ncbi:MAG: CHAT domain-containing protein [Cyanobacteria bacterium P01_A01_bin.137]
MKTILVLASNPKETSNLDLDREIREIREGLRQSPHRDQYNIEWRGAVRPVDLRRALLEVNPQIVHFCGHGNDDNGLVLEDDDGHALMISSDALSNLFAVFAQQVECIVLNACYSETQADALVQQINYVVGMSQEIPDEAAIAFSVGFYEAVGADRSIEDAHQLGCVAIQMEYDSSRPARDRKLIPIHNPNETQPQPLPAHLIPALKKRTQLNPITLTSSSQAADRTPQIKSLIGHSDWIRSIAISPEGKTLLSSSNDKTLRLWDLQTGQLLYLLTGHRQRIKAIGFSPDGNNLLSCSNDSQAKAWDIAQLPSKKTGDCRYTIKASSKAITLVNELPVNPDPDRACFATGAAHGKVSLWNTQTGAWIRTIPAHSSSVLAATFSPDGKFLATGSHSSTIKLWDLDKPGDQPLYSRSNAHLSQVLSLAISAEHQTLISSGADRTIKLWDLNTGDKKRPHILEGHAGRVWDVAISPDGQTIASASADFTVKLWSVETGRLLKTLAGHLGEVRSVTFGPGNTLLASGGDDLEIKLWQV